MQRAASPSMVSLSKGDGDRLEGPLDTVSVLFSDPVDSGLPGILVSRIRRGSRPAGRGGVVPPEQMAGTSCRFRWNRVPKMRL